MESEDRRQKSEVERKETKRIRKSEDSHSMVIQLSFNGHSMVKQNDSEANENRMTTK
jgi:hypothetical protein